MSYVLAVHGGAGTILPGERQEEPYHRALEASLAAGQQVLAAGGTALQAVVAAVVALEDCPLFNAGLGAVFNAEEFHELDAGVMEGAQLSAGAMAGVRTLRNPILGAEAVRSDGLCVLMEGRGAEAFGAARGMAVVPNDYFSTNHRREQLFAARATASKGMVLDHAPPMHGARFGTVGAVALDAHGLLAAATSTGGMTNKRPGRVGDTPVPGAGFYANNASCAVSTTGTGEHFLRACVGYDIHARMAYGRQDLAVAAAAALEGAQAIGGSGGLIAIDRRGNVATPFNSAGMYHGVVRSGGPVRTSIFQPLGHRGAD